MKTFFAKYITILFVTTSTVIFLGSNLTNFILKNNVYNYTYSQPQIPFMLKDLAISAAKTCRSPQNVYLSLVKTESDWNYRAISKAGAKGLSQLMELTAAELYVTNRFSPNDNLIGGACYLSYLIRYYDGDIRTALHAYNAGMGNVAKGKIGKKTFKYASKILAEADEE